jgi:hypothetical protein
MIFSLYMTRDTVQYLEKAALGWDKTDEPVTGRVSKPDLAGASLYSLSDILCNIHHTVITQYLHKKSA